MSLTIREIELLLYSRESEHLEFKEAKRRFDVDLLVKYCAALANEGGGKIVLGISDKLPRTVVGTTAFPEPERVVGHVIDMIRIKVVASEVIHPKGRVLVFEVPSRPVGFPIEVKGAYFMRGGDGLVGMTPDMLKRIFAESEPDFSARLCLDAIRDDLDPGAIRVFRDAWYRKSGNRDLLEISDEQLLVDAELIVGGKISFAALVLLGRPRSLSRLLPQAEVIFEYRITDAPGAAQQREEFRRGFMLYHDELWQIINLRNEVQHFHEGLFVRDIRTFNEIAIREAVLNAVAHRDYQLNASTFVRQYPRRLEITSPGGLPSGITPKNILWQQNPRNRRIAEALARCGFVERSGQGVDLMVRESVRESKPGPSFADSDSHHVSVVLSGKIDDPKFIQFLEQVGQETLSLFSSVDFLALDYINRDIELPIEFRERIPRLIDLGLVETVGKGRGARYFLSRRLYDFVGKSGTYTRKRGLDRATNKALLVNHIRDYHERGGSRMKDLQQVLPALTRGQIKTLLRELQVEGRICSHGRTRAGRWYLNCGQ